MENAQLEKIGTNINILAENRDKALFIDVECACWENKRVPQGQRMDIIEIGIATFDLYSHAVEPKESILVKPQSAEISEYCTDLTGITQEELDEKGITIEEAFKKLWKRYEANKRFWFSWGQEDRRFIYNDSKFYGIDNPMHVGHCDVRSLFFSKFTRQHELLRHNPNLQQAINMAGLEFKGEAHSALSDAYNTARLYKKIIEPKR